VKVKSDNGGEHQIYVWTTPLKKSETLKTNDG